jgi:hypothetical protein
MLEIKVTIINIWKCTAAQVLGMDTIDSTLRDRAMAHASLLHRARFMTSRTGR